MSSKPATGRFLAFVAALGLSAIGAASAIAGTTALHAGSSASECDQAQILSHCYGGSFTASGYNFTNGSVTATRCDDSTSTNAAINSSATTNQIQSDDLWSGGVFSGHVVSRFAGYNQSLGYFDGAAGGGYQNLFDVSGSGFNVTGSFAGLNTHGNTFRWARGGDGNTYSSDAADNGGEDHLVTYRITGAGSGTTWLLCWEDLGGAGSDWDFNDLVVELKSSAPLAIPLPPAVWSGLSVIVGGGLWGTFRRIRRWLA